MDNYFADMEKNSNATSTKEEWQVPMKSGMNLRLGLNPMLLT
jgi:hypothetical protein